MAFHVMLCQIGALSLSLSSGESFADALEPPLASSGFHPQTNGQTERANQDLERVLRCLSSQNPTSWCRHLAWAEYAHNSLPVAATGLSPFQCSLGYQPPLFSSQESEASVPSVQAFIRRCKSTWRRARAALLHSGSQVKRGADRRRVKAPHYRRGQRVWLSTKDLCSGSSQ